MRIAFIGLGNMGMPMAIRLKNAGHTVIGYNRSYNRSEEFSRQGGEISTTVREAVKDASVVITMLSDDIAVESVSYGSENLIESLGINCVHLSMSTISPSLSRKLSKAHEAKKGIFISAPVLGRPEAAEQGNLFILTAGHQTRLDRLIPIFDILGKKTFDLGDDPGASNIVKLSCNFLLASLIESLSEAFALIRKAGINPENYLNLLTTTLFSGGAFEVYGKHILRNDFKPGFKVPLALKDMELGIAAGKDLAVPLPIASLIRDHFIEAVAKGCSDLDWSSLALVSMSAAGIINSPAEFNSEEAGILKRSA